MQTKDMLRFTMTIDKHFREKLRVMAAKQGKSTCKMVSKWMYERYDQEIKQEEAALTELHTSTSQPCESR